MTFVENLEKVMRKRFVSGGEELMEDGLEDILDSFIEHGEYLNKIPSDEVESLLDLTEELWDYHLLKRDYEDFKNGETYMIFPKRDNTTTPGKIRSKQNINILKKARDLLKFVSSKDFRIAQGMNVSILDSIKELVPPKKKEFEPIPPMQWQTKKNGNQKYKNIKNYCFTRYEDKEVALKAFNQTIDLYEQADKYPFYLEYKVGKDVFNTYWFLTSLIEDLEKQEFYYFERTEYYNPEKPSKKKIKDYLHFLRGKYNLKASHHEKQLIDNL